MSPASRSKGTGIAQDHRDPGHGARNPLWRNSPPPFQRRRTAQVAPASTVHAVCVGSGRGNPAVHPPDRCRPHPLTGIRREHRDSQMLRTSPGFNVLYTYDQVLRYAWNVASPANPLDYHVPRMDCESRVQDVVRMVAKLPGARKIEADARTQHLRLELDETRTSRSVLEDNLLLLGYAARPFPEVLPAPECPLPEAARPDGPEQAQSVSRQPVPANAPARDLTDPAPTGLPDNALTDQPSPASPAGAWGNRPFRKTPPVHVRQPRAGRGHRRHLPSSRTPGQGSFPDPAGHSADPGRRPDPLGHMDTDRQMKRACGSRAGSAALRTVPGTAGVPLPSAPDRTCL